MRFFLYFLIPVFVNGTVFASDRHLQHFLEEFHRNPEKVMSQLPPEIKDGKVIQRGSINDEILNSALLEQKEKIRSEIKDKSIYQSLPLTAIGDGDRPVTLVDGMLVSNLLEIDRRGLMRASLPYTLWSDTYWPISKGLTAQRYADSYEDPHNWPANYSRFLSMPTHTVPTDVLSPAEKYDLLVGDTSLSLTHYSWNSGRQYVDRYGHVPTWMGICHGWSAANHMKAQIPYGSVVLKSVNGTPIRFFQSDVKALQSMLWAYAPVPTRFVGFRCNGTPPRDNTGRVSDNGNCYDTNAGTFFLSATNQIGINKRGFVMDAQYDAQVWNFSLISYKGTYFNPQTLHQTANVRQALVPLNQFSNDKFKKHRAPGTAYVVGVMMDVTHMNETRPSHKVQTENATKTVRYVLDLELDSNYNVIGGEWYTRAFPDFLWSYAPEAQAMAPGDADVNYLDWNTNENVPASWTTPAKKSSRKGLPMFSVIRKIVEAAPKTPAP